MRINNIMETNVECLNKKCTEDTEDKSLKSFDAITKGNLIAIEPKIKFLTGEEMIKARNIKVETSQIGLKRAVPSESKEENKELNTLYNKLHQSISKPRIERSSGRAAAVWDETERRVQVTRKDGKFDNFGYSIKGNHYLDFYEAIFLLELNRLEIKYQSQAMSVEQAYLLLLGEDSSAKYNEYYVYSSLTRIGYIVVRYNYQRYVEHTEPASEIDCAWELLYSSLYNKSVPDYVRRSEHFQKIKYENETIKKKITCQINDNVEEVSDTEEPINFDQKLTAPSDMLTTEPDGGSYYATAKRFRVNNQFKTTSFLNLLEDDDIKFEYQKFKKIFKQFDVVKLKIDDSNTDDNFDIDNDDDDHQLHINFDLFLHNTGFKKSTPTAPAFRVVILQENKSFPTHDEIKKCYRRQILAVPLLIIDVGECKHMQAFLYHFS